MLHPSSIKVQILHTYGQTCTHDTITAGVSVNVVKGLSPFRPSSYRETEYVKQYAAEEVWHILYGGLNRSIAEIQEFVYTKLPFNEQSRHLELLLGNLSDKLKFNQPPLPQHPYANLIPCPPVNQQPPTTETSSATPTVAEKEIKAESVTQPATSQISQKEWENVCGALSGKSTGHGSPQESAPTSSLSTEENKK